MCKQRNWRYIQCETESWYYFRIKIETELLIVMTRNCDSTKIFEKNYFIYYIRKYKASKVACFNFYKKNTAIKITVDHQKSSRFKINFFYFKRRNSLHVQSFGAKNKGPFSTGVNFRKVTFGEYFSSFHWPSSTRYKYRCFAVILGIIKNKQMHQSISIDVVTALARVLHFLSLHV